MYVSFGFRFRAEVEALNMAEAVGNYTRHRTAPVMVVERDQDGRVIAYKVTMAPAVSGQSIAFGFMSALVKLANQRNLPVCDECQNYSKLGGFFKRADRLEIGRDERIRTCVVEDVTGFMATKERGGGEKGGMIRRTSPVMFSYMVPDSYSARGVVMPQLHVRYNLQNPQQQVPYQVEAGTAIYVHGVAIDVERIGRFEDSDGYVGDRKARIEAVFDALKALYGGLLFGAKKARYTPIFEALGGIAAVSHPIPFTVSPPRMRDYVEENAKRAAAYIGEVSLFCFDKEGITSCGKTGDKVKAVSNLEELINSVKDLVLNKIK
jgi:CRISPR-associated protein Csa2